jgi:hypothetical protein
MSHELRTPLNSIIGFSELLAGKRVHSATRQKRYAHRHPASPGADALGDYQRHSRSRERSRAGKMEMRLSEFGIDAGDSRRSASSFPDACQAEEHRPDGSRSPARRPALVPGPSPKVQQLLNNLLVQRHQVHARRGPHYRRLPGAIARGRIELCSGHRHGRRHRRESDQQVIFEKVPPGALRPWDATTSPASIQRHGLRPVDRPRAVQAAGRAK